MDGPDREGVPYRRLGRTNERVSCIGLGGYHLGDAEDEAAVSLVREALDGGINFLDNSWDYHDGRSERLMGEALEDGYRERAFLMTKVDGRVRDLAWRQLHDSLERLKTDTIDLVQFHEVIRPWEPHRIFEKGGALEALLRAREERMIRYIGFTGHKDPVIHLEMLDVAFEHGFVFDTVQMPLNLLDRHYRSFETHVLPTLLENDIGVLGVKPLAAGHLMRADVVSAEEALLYALSLPTSVVITGIEDRRRLRQALDVARGFEQLDEEHMDALRGRTAQIGSQGEYELYKTADVHDGTSSHPEWLQETART